MSKKRLRVKDLALPDLNRLKEKLNPKTTKYIPHIPFPKQAAFLLLPHKEAFYGGAAGGGKDLSLSTSIITDNGWTTVGELTTEDRVAALDGTWTEIEYVTQERMPEKVYRITFSNGQKIDCSDTHLWMVYRTSRIITTAEHIMITKKTQGPKGLRKYYTLPRHKIAETKQLKNETIYIKDIEEVEPMLVKCIKVRHPSHTFLVGETQIPTHNSDALLMSALQYVDIPGYAAILFRKTYKELALPEALIFRSKEWLSPYMNKGDVRWSEQDKMFTFPSGATLSFGYLETDSDMMRYQSAEFQFIGFDELTHFKERHYRYLFSRLRRLKGVDIPLRMRSASNPGSQGHEWVKNRFLIEGPSKGRIFIPATLDDNKHIDREEYLKSLAELDPVTREQLEKGDWDIEPEGNMFKRDWFEIVEAAPTRAARVRYWDLAATEAKDNKDPDWTVGVKMAAKDGIYYIEDVRRVREDPGSVVSLVKHTASVDGKAVPIFIEEEPGSSGKNNTYHYQRYVLPGYACEGDRVTGSKIIRANPLSSAAKVGNVKLVRGMWNSDFLDEIALFPLGNYKDQVDATSGAHSKINEKRIIQSDPDAMKALRGARVYSRSL